MGSPAISYYLILIFLIVAVVATAYKWYRLGILRRKHKVHLQNSLFTLYPAEYIFSTTSPKKRDFMIASNRATYISIIALGIMILIIVVVLIRELDAYLDTVN
jgi:hypothetical protein